jgi:hypothetical protein
MAHGRGDVRTAVQIAQGATVAFSGLDEDRSRKRGRVSVGLERSQQRSAEPRVVGLGRNGQFELFRLDLKGRNLRGCVTRLFDPLAEGIRAELVAVWPSEGTAFDKTL